MAKTAVMEQYDREKDSYQLFCNAIERLLTDILRWKGISCNAIASRLKDRDSLSKKIDRKGDKYGSLSDITDIAGVRVITYYSNDVDKVADIIEREFVVDRENSIDKREALEPDRFGYCSVHYVVGMSEERLALPEYCNFSGLKCEIQIRSVLQHAWAEIEHDIGYKSEIALPRDIRRNFSRLAGLLEIADKEFLEIRQFLLDYSEEIHEKVERGELEQEDVTLDAITLKSFLASDPEIGEINRMIMEHGSEINPSSAAPEDLTKSLERLQWFYIGTLGDLKDMLQRNRDYLPAVIEEYLGAGKDGEGRKEKHHYSSTIALFFLCYAELLSEEMSLEDIVRYQDDLVICLRREDREANAKKLLSVGEKVRKELGIVEEMAAII